MINSELQHNTETITRILLLNELTSIAETYRLSDDTLNIAMSHIEAMSDDDVNEVNIRKVKNARISIRSFIETLLYNISDAHTKFVILSVISIDIYRYLVRKYNMISPDDIHDILGDSIVNMLSNSDRVVLSSLRTYLHRTVEFKIRDFMRSSHDTIENLDIPYSQEIASDINNSMSQFLTNHKDIAQAIDRLPAKQRKAILLYLNGESYENIASEMGIANVTVRANISRAREKIRNMLLALWA